MKAIYSAIDGYKLDGNETLASLMSEDSVKGVNLISNPMDVATWTTGNSATLTKSAAFKNAELVLTNGAALAGYVSRSFNTTAGTYYLIRAYSDNDGVTQTRVSAGTSLGNNNLGASAFNGAGVNELILKATGAETFVNLQNDLVATYVSYWSQIEVIALEHVGVDETTQLQTNGTFTTDASSWTGYQATLAAVAGELETTLTSTSGGAYQDITGLTAGQVYKLTAKIRRGTASGNTRVALYDGASFTTLLARESNATTSDETHEIEAAPTGTTLRIYLEVIGSSSETGYADDVTLTKSGNLVSNGGFDVDNGWTKGTGITISGGTATHTGAVIGAMYTAYNLDLEVGKSYVLTFDTSGVSGGGIVYLSTSAGAFRGESWQVTTDGTGHAYTVTCTHESTLYFVMNYEISIGNVSVRLAEVDSSANGDGLEVHGEIVKVPVNYNSTTVAYANFSENNFLKQPYSSNLDPATSDLSYSFWFKRHPNSSAELMVDRDSSTSAQRYASQIDATGYIDSIIDDNTTTSTASSDTTAYDDGLWHHCAIVFDQNNAASPQQSVNYLYIDGGLVTSTSTTVLNTLSNTSADLYVGVSAALANVFGGFIAGIKIDIGNAWTAQKILTDYNSEKVLYRPNELYSVVGTELTLSCGAVEGTHQELVNYTHNEAVDGSREYNIKNTKRAFSITTTPINDLKKLQKFLRSTAAQSFTISEKSFEYGADNEMTVYRTSKGEQISRVGFGLYRVGFNVREK